MNAKNAFEYLTEQIRYSITDYLYKCEHRTDAKYFSRQSTLSFKTVMLLVLHLVKRSAAMEIFSFFSKTETDQIPSRQAIAKARSKVNYTAFQELFRHSAKIGLEIEDAKCYHGYRLFAIDGTTFLLPHNQELEAYFGSGSPAKGHLMARVVSVVDLLNDFIAEAVIGPYSKGERVSAMECIERLRTIERAVFIFDRGFWSPELITTLIENKQKYIMRLQKNAVLAITNSEENSGKINLKYKGKNNALRYYKFYLENDNLEILITNLEAEEISDKELAELYAKRWGIEVKYYELKVRLEMDSFSGNSVLFILQDFYAALLISNYATFATYLVKDELEKKSKAKNLKNKQKPNRAITLGMLREMLVELVVTTNPCKQKKLQKRLKQGMLRHVSYEREPRPRKRKSFLIRNKRPRRIKSIL